MTVTSALLQFRRKPSRTHKPVNTDHAESDILRLCCTCAVTQLAKPFRKRGKRSVYSSSLARFTMVYYVVPTCQAILLIASSQSFGCKLRNRAKRLQQRSHWYSVVHECSAAP